MFTRYANLGEFEIEISSIVRTNRFFFLLGAWQSKEGFIPLTLKGLCHGSPVHFV